MFSPTKCFSSREEKGRAEGAASAEEAAKYASRHGQNQA